MIKLENVEIVGWEAAIRGMRNPLNSHHLSDSEWGERGLSADEYYDLLSEDNPYPKGEAIYCVGPNDLKLMNQLASGGPVHAKYRRMIQVYVNITAPLYWWKEMDTYKVGTVANSCSTMHKIHERDLTPEVFSREHLDAEDYGALLYTIERINACRKTFIETGDKQAWHSMIQLLPSSYNQKRTWMANYEVLANIYHSRKDHKLDEWREFCKWIETLPYSEIITGGKV